MVAILLYFLIIPITAEHQVWGVENGEHYLPPEISSMDLIKKQTVFRLSVPSDPKLAGIKPSKSLLRAVTMALFSAAQTP